MDRPGRGRRSHGGGDPGHSLIDSILVWLAQLPPLAVYAVIAAFATIENILPPAPADVVVALGAFLSHRGHTTALVVFAVTWTFNVAGAILVYTLARRYGENFFSTGLGRRLLSPHSVQFIEREYLRFGLWGIILGRLVPGVRSFVAPFTGLIRLSPARALVPIAVASAIWYGGIVFLASYLGSSWSRIATFLDELNRDLLTGAAIILAIGAGWYLLRRLRRSRETDAWELLEQAFGSAGSGPLDTDHTAKLASATLMAELARGGRDFTPEEGKLVASYLAEVWGLNEDLRPLRSLGPGRLPDLAKRVKKDYLLSQRLKLMERLWNMALSDRRLEEQESRLMQRAGTLLGLSEEDV
ncbi:MAG: VTT domain-containing protein, partial [Gemmatimonadales bacterium]